jgi:uncharacterized protein (TIGR03067 family)
MSQDLDRLQGTWNIVSLEMEGMSMPCGGAQIAIAGDAFTTSGMGATYNGKVVVFPDTSPPSFDLQFLDGPEKGNTSLGIYELAGDAWKICLTTRGTVRPTTFAAPPGTGIALEVLHRGAPAVTSTQASTSAVSSGVTGDPAPELAGEWAMVSVVINGDALPKSMAKHGRRHATSSEVTVKMGPDVILQALYSVDRSASPMTMDYWRTEGTRQSGIWKFEGGELTTCFGPIGAPRPAEFASQKGDGRTFAVWTKL